MSTTEPEGAGGGQMGGGSGQMGGGGGQMGGGEGAREQARTMLGGVTAGSRGDLARLPIPGNAEFVFLTALAILLAIIAAIADSFDTRG